MLLFLHSCYVLPKGSLPPSVVKIDTMSYVFTIHFVLSIVNRILSYLYLYIRLVFTKAEIIVAYFAWIGVE